MSSIQLYILILPCLVVVIQWAAMISVSCTRHRQQIMLNTSQSSPLRKMICLMKKTAMVSMDLRHFGTSALSLLDSCAENVSLLHLTIAK